MDDPKGQAGITALAARVMAEGGTQSLDAKSLIVALFPMATSIGARVDKEQTTFAATAHKDGRLSDIEVVDVALIPGFADSVSSALRSMSRGALAPFVGDADSIPFIMQISSEENPDTVPTFRYLFKARVPRYDVPFSYASMPMAGVDAEYPFTARIAGVGDSVTVAFTVDWDGTVVPQSIELVRASYRDFVSSVFKALAHTRYHPAHLGDCAVATRMKQRFLFKAPE